MSYRYFQRNNRHWPKRLADAVGRFVRLKKDIETMGGTKFPRGRVMEITSVHRGKLTLRWWKNQSQCIRKVWLSDVSLMRKEDKRAEAR
jgi:hypothetical protein